MVGRNLLEHPLAAKWEILKPSSKDLDLRDREAVAAFVRAARPNLVIHAAGQVGGIQANITDPVGFLVNNIDIGRNVILGSFEAGVPAFINLASSCMYPRDHDQPLRESEIMTGQLEPTNEGYALAKIFSTRLCEYIMRINPEVRYSTLIPCNIYGRHDKFDPSHSHLIAAIIAKMTTAQREGHGEVEIWGDGTARREFMYAGDLADAILRAAEEQQNIPDKLNIGVGIDHTILEYYETVARVLDWKGTFRFDPTRPTGMRRKLNDISQQRSWGWSPSNSLFEGIRKTIQYYREQIRS
jgi:GDP-L-fucose synthase